MKKYLLLSLIIISANWAIGQNLQPYIIGFESTKSIETTKELVKTNLQANAIKVVGEYQPAADKNRWVITFTSNELLNSVKLVGGKTGFAAVLRIGITIENGKTVVSYTNPMYWGNAYYQDSFEKVRSNYTTLNSHLEKAMKACGTFSGNGFGSKKGISEEDLRDYHYMMGMPYFEDTEELGEFSDHQTAVARIDAALKKGVPNLTMIYKVTIPGKKLTLYGFGLSGSTGESNFMPIIDIGSPKHTAFLPYEVLVNDDEVEMLHGRFRIAISFPDLTMGTFSKIMSTPGDIEDLLEQLVK